MRAFSRRRQPAESLFYAVLSLQVHDDDDCCAGSSTSYIYIGARVMIFFSSCGYIAAGGGADTRGRCTRLRLPSGANTAREGYAVCASEMTASISLALCVSEIRDEGDEREREETHHWCSAAHSIGVGTWKKTYARWESERTASSANLFA